MAWKPAEPRARHRSIRGRISGPIPVAPSNTIDDEFPMRDSRAPLAAPRDHGAAADDATPDARHLDRVRHQPPLDDLSRSQAAASALPERDPAVRETLPGREPAHGPHRRRTTLRSALAKLLGRRKTAANAHMSEPPVKRSLAESIPQHDSNSSGCRDSSSTAVQQTRYTSMPVTEYDRALRSHSIGPDDVLDIQSVRNSLNAELRQPGKKADVSEVKLAHPPAPHWNDTRRFTGLTPRPASSHHRRPSLADWSDDPNEIGRAITSDVKGLRRRSRSLSAVPITDGAFLGLSRRRSDEIRHWRESYQGAANQSAPSAPANQFDGVGPLPVQEPASTVAGEDQLKSSALRFVFGDMTLIKEASGHETTEAARPSLRSRASILEVRMSRLEQLVTEMTRSLPSFSPPSNSCVPLVVAEHPFLAATAPGHDDYDGSASSKPLEATKATLSGDAQPSPRSTLPLSQSTSLNASRPLSLATLRGAVGPLGHDSGGLVTVDHYLALVSLLETERAAREALEFHVRKLGQQMNLATKLAGYARPTTGHISSAEGSLGGTSAFDNDQDEDGHWAKSTEEPPCDIMGFEGKAKAHDVDEGGEADSFAESFTTPNEDHVDDGYETAWGKATRALSLSRITLSSNGQHPMHQAAPPAT